MNPRWRKIWGDLRESPTRALLVVLAIAISTATLMVAVGARAILTREITTSFASGNPAAAVFVLPRVDDVLVAQVRHLPGVADAEARRVVRARVEVAPGDWRTLLLFGIRDFTDLRVSTFRAETGVWPPTSGAVLVERSALPVLRTTTGDTLHIRVPGGIVADVPVQGIVHDPGVAPGWQDNVGYAYVTSATLARLGLGERFDELHITISNANDRAAATRVATTVTDWLAEQGQVVQRVEVPLQEHPHADHMATLLLLLTVFSLLALILNGALVANLLAGLLARQVRQIGVFKAVGATSWQIAGIYLRFVLLLATVAVVLGVPLGVAGARAFAAFAATQLNLELASLAIPPMSFALVVGIGLGWPLLATIIPVMRAARMTARAALQSAGVLSPVATSGWRVLPPLLGNHLVVLALRNTVRRPVRLALTLGALALGGALLMTAVNVYAGLLHAVDTSLAGRGDDIDVRLLQPAPADALATTARNVPGVQVVEVWGAVLATIALPDAPARDAIGSGRYSVLAPPTDTALLRLPLAEGNWPRANDAGAVVVSRNLQAAEPGLTLGAEVTLLLGERRALVRVVGVLEDVSPPAFYTTPATLELLTGQPNSAGALRLVTEGGRQQAVATALEGALINVGYFPSFLMTRDTLRTSMVDHFLILLLLLLDAALASVVVGGLGLATSTSLNVLERQREIGIVRAIGATRRTVLRMLLLEGTAVMMASLLVAIVLALPLSAAVSWLVGRYGLHVAVPLVVSPWAIGAWALVAAVLTTLAYILPARDALRLPTREVLVYE
jgi:putative ABC transport system permease protein